MSMGWQFSILFFHHSSALIPPGPSHKNEIQSSSWGLPGSASPASSFFEGLGSLSGLSSYPSPPMLTMFQHWLLCSSLYTLSILPPQNLSLAFLSGMFFLRVFFCCCFVLFCFASLLYCRPLWNVTSLEKLLWPLNLKWNLPSWHSICFFCFIFLYQIFLYMT